VNRPERSLLWSTSAIVMRLCARACVCACV
jgi:hypothetical protein